jgi:hypothetical protein
MSRRNWLRVMLAACALAFIVGVAQPSTPTQAAPDPTPTATPRDRGGDPGHG